MDQDSLIKEAEERIREAQLMAEQAKMNQVQSEQDVSISENEKGMISEQLDLGEEKDTIHNLLKGMVLEKDKENGNTKWVEPTNKDMIILSDYGINYIMGSVQWYLNKNTLLSNYDDVQISAKMEDLATTMTDDVFMEYDKMFLYPTLEDCKDEIKERISGKVEVRKFALELLGKEANEEEIEKEILSEMEDKIERELNIIKEKKIKNKLKRFESLMRFIQDIIHSAYQRAWKGQERTTLRQHIHISENKGGGFAPEQQQSGFNPLGILRRRR